MIMINEWLPSPATGNIKDEFVELWNSSGTPVDMRGWSIKGEGKQRVALSGVVPANGYLVLYRAQTKLVLRKTDGGIGLYDAGGKLADQSDFTGTAPKGMSFNRIPNPVSSLRPAGEGATNFAWGEPTPGAPNHITANTSITYTDNPMGVPINTGTLDIGGFIAILLGTAVLLTGIIMYSIKANENLSDIFCPRDKKIRA